MTTDTHPKPDPANLFVRVTQRADIDWPEGDYQCSCVHCGASYIGPKRSACCQKCRSSSIPAGDVGKVVEALELGRDYVASELLHRQDAYAGYPHKWASEQEDLRTMDAALASLRGAALLPQMPTDVEKDAQRLDLTELYKLAQEYCSSDASPHHITFTVHGLRNLVDAAIAKEPKHAD